MHALLNTLGFILRHPLNRATPVSALSRFLKWQLGSRLLPWDVAVPFVGKSRLLIRKGMTGATGNIYCGLHEFEDMALVLHALRPDDLFVDVGANVGSYTILAAGVSGAFVLAIEPIPKTFEHLLDNIRINRLDTMVTAKNIGVGSRTGNIQFTESLDTVNHVLTDNEAATEKGITVLVETLDELLIGHAPALIKVDVEGYETEVVKGGLNALMADGLLAVLIELNGSGNRYGFDEDKLHGELMKNGFVPCRYQPFERRIVSMEGKRQYSGNTLYVRDIAALQQRVKTAQEFTVFGQSI